MQEHELACDCPACLPNRTAVARMWTEVEQILGERSHPHVPLDDQVVYLLRALADSRYESHVLRQRNAQLTARVRELTSLVTEVTVFLEGSGDGQPDTVGR